MTALILCTPKVFLQSSADEWHDATGGDAILLSGNVDHPTSEAIKDRAKQSFLEVHLFDDYENNDLVEKTAVDLSKLHHINAILSFSEADVCRAARIRKAIGIIGQTLDDAQFFRDKTLMKRRAWERGLAVPRFAQLTCPDDLLDFIAANKLPVVVKPYDGRGSAGVEVLKSDDNVRAFLSRGVSTSKAFTVEEFVPGNMYRVDGLYINGLLVVMQIGRYLKDCLAFIRGETIGTHALNEDNPLVGRIEGFTKHLLEHALPLPKTSIFHLQLFHTPDDKLVLCEVASRLGGGVINEEVLYATGIDIKMAYVKASVSKDERFDADYKSPYTPTARIIIPPRPATLTKLPGSCDFPWVNTYRAYGVVGRQYGGPAMTNAEIASFVFHGSNEIELQSRAAILENWFHSHSEWST
ncbi:hypothetical protein IAE29_23450 [Ochrobactrum sp. S46]|nr:hypothetical protein [Ochrobactrum sp. S45]MBK0046277.1 hypothetical protein [Ochrobactrum sp. S46]